MNRDGVRIWNLVPCRAPGDDFSKHHPDDVEWGLELTRKEVLKWTGTKVIVLMGPNPLKWFTGLEGIGDWRGSVLTYDHDLSLYCEDGYGNVVQQALQFSLGKVAVPDGPIWLMPTYHPEAVARERSWAAWFNMDLAKAQRLALGHAPRCKPYQWQLDPLEGIQWIHEMARQEGHVSIDSEFEPYPIIALSCAGRVTSFAWSEELREPLQALLADENVTKVAHNISHDWRYFEKVFSLTVRYPFFDTMCGSHVLNVTLQKSLAPHISTRFTNRPFHKYLSSLDPIYYCGLDAIVAEEGYLGEIAALEKRGQLDYVKHLHYTQRVFLYMQSRGVLVDEEERQRLVEVKKREEEEWIARFQELADPLVDRELEKGSKGRLKSPQLFQQRVTCSCCRNGAGKLAHCWSCAGFERNPTKGMLLERFPAGDSGLKAAELRASLLGPCTACQGRGQWIERTPASPSSTSQVGDVLYRTGLGIAPRMYKKKETVNQDSLIPLRDRFATDPRRRYAHALLDAYLQWSVKCSERETLERLEPDVDGRLHSVFHHYTARTMRVASREGLLDKGTNLMNIPKDARSLLVADPGYVSIAPDYRQIEARAVAVLSKDKWLTEAFLSEEDVHVKMRDILRAVLPELTRDQSKRLLFAALYGIEVEHAAHILHSSHAEADRVLQLLWRTVSGVKRYHDATRRSLLSSSSVSSPTSFVRPWTERVMYTSGKRQGQVVPKILKEALATLPQNMARYVMDLGLSRLFDAVVLDREEPLVEPLIDVHDGLKLQAREEHLPEALAAVEKYMTVREWGMDFPIEMSIGPNWYIAGLDDEKKKGTEWERYTLAAVA